MMPTVIVLDSSLSLCQRTSPGSGSGAIAVPSPTRFQLLVQGASYFLSILEEQQPLESTAVISFSSRSTVVSPFSTDFPALRTALDSIHLQDKTCPSVGLEAAQQLVQECFGGDRSCQLVLLTDGRPNGGQPLDTLQLQGLRVHIIAIGASSEVESTMEGYRGVVGKTGGSIQTVELPHNSHALKQCFDSLVCSHYGSYSGLLACGNLKCNVSVQPNPNIELFRILSNQGGNVAGGTFPTVLPITGFLPNKKIPSPPAISRHIILPATSTDTTMCLLLNEALKAEKTTAFVMLEPDWFAIISSLYEKDSSALCLSVFRRDMHISWIGELSKLASVRQPNFFPLPLRTFHQRSYPSKPSYTIPYVTKDLLQSDLQKIVRYARNLPQKQQILTQECERLRSVAEVYYLPSLKDNIVAILQQEMNTADGSTAAILRDTIYRMKEVHQTPMEETVNPKSAMNVSNLIT